MEGLTRALVGAILAATIGVPAGFQSGTWALSSGTPRVAAYEKVTHLPGDMVTLDLFETALGSNTPLHSYDLDMTQLMHVIVVTSDFTQFMHLHPHFDASSGQFNLTMQLNPAQRYYVYADAEPSGKRQQVYRFTIDPITHGFFHYGHRSLAPSQPRISAGGYVVTLPKTVIAANEAQLINVAVTRDGAPANDLQPYLGAAAHAVLINTSTLAYVHVHPTVRGAPEMDMDSGMHLDAAPKAGPNMTMHLPALAPGVYKLWLQFEGKGGLAVAPFTLVAR